MRIPEKKTQNLIKKIILFLLCITTFLLLLIPKIVKSDVDDIPLSPSVITPPKQAKTGQIGGYNRVGDRVKMVTVAPEEVARIKELITHYFPSDPIMIHIAEAESSFDCGVKNASSSARGCFQILAGTWADHNCVGDTLIAEDNIACAAKIHAKEGTQPWNPSKDKWGKFLK